MHYTSWEPRSSGQPATLVVGKGPEKLAVFGVEKADVSGDTWLLATDGANGVRATTTEGREFSATGAGKRAKRVDVDLDGKKLAMVNENSSNWVVLTADQVKIAQFSGTNNGVRRAILEFVPDAENTEAAQKSIAELSQEDVVALSWFVRTILEAKLSRMTGMVIVTLVALSILAVLTFLL
ncbi:hypothetical protein CATYP_07780 [Corynebacterium atypicum]|uniref:Lipoprotein LpqB beta-propeller domain-containing protein n=1 Tax=Corynebacterium atypicum TaxID=191610 RepID=A0ABM5QNU8_9CORY|nr:hypothetical protein CATYP_07780 [Corynebacterium atypicum]